jgi:hypothetical protein
VTPNKLPGNWTFDGCYTYGTPSLALSRQIADMLTLVIT